MCLIYSAGSHLSAGISACCDDIKLVWMLQEMFMIESCLCSSMLGHMFSVRDGV